jgi:hypothetical protein
VGRRDERIAKRVLLVEKARIGARLDVVPHPPLTYDERDALACIVLVHDRGMARHELLDPGRAGKAPLRNLEVDLVPDTGAVSVVLARATTDSGGAFFIDAPSLGTYRLLFKIANTPMLTTPIPLMSASEVVQREFRVEIPAPRDYIGVEVEQSVRQKSGGTAPRYPDELRAADVEGEVLAQFVVDTTGKADMQTFKVLRSPDPQFTASVRLAVPYLDFYPAQLAGRRVRQVVLLPFLFCLNGAPSTRAGADTSRYWWLTRTRPRECAGQ